MDKAEIYEARKAALIADIAISNANPPKYLTDKQLKISLFKTHLDRLE